jgi:hypothetical protein
MAWRRSCAAGTRGSRCRDRGEGHLGAGSNPSLADGDLFLYGKVEYRDQPLTIPLEVGDLVKAGIAEVLDHLQVLKGAASHLYMTKNTDWQSEQEDRVVVVRWDVPTSEENQPLEIDFVEALKAIVLGEQYPDDVRPLLGGRKGVDVLRCWWGDGVPMLASG